MKNSPRILTILFAAAVIAGSFAACSSSSESNNGDEDRLENETEQTDQEPEEETEGKYPDRNFIFEIRNRGSDPAIKDETYKAKETSHYRVADKLPTLDAKVIKNIGGAIYVGTAAGLYKLDETSDAFKKENLTDDAQAVIDIADSFAADGTLIVAHPDSLEFKTSAGHNQIAGAGFTSVAVSGDTVYAGHSAGLIKMLTTENTPTNLTEFDGIAVKDVAVSGANVYAATDAGVLVYDGANVAAIEATAKFAALSTCADGKVLAGGETEALIIDGKTISKTIKPEPGSLPTDKIIAVSCSENYFLFGHEIGASSMSRDLKTVEHFISQRWVLDNKVVSVAEGKDKSRWFAGNKGVSAVKLVDRKLKDKADALQKLLDDYAWRLGGFVAPDLWTPDAFSMDGVKLSDSDNDGLWTQMMIGAWAYAKGVTGDEKYCDAARKAIKNMLMEIDLPCISFKEKGMKCGFVTRSFVREDEGELFTSKSTQSNWHLVTYEGKQYYWKDDTSSDETTGHFYGYPLYYDHCATEAEKKEIGEKLGSLAAYIIDGGFYLIDLDGQQTTHGHWAPDHTGACVNGFSECLAILNDDIETCGDSCYGGGWLNSLEILGHMLVAWHVTGDPKFYDAYDKLIVEHGYDKMATFTKDVYTATRRSIQNHSDHELAMLAYHSLIRYEPNEDRRKIWQKSLTDFHEWEKLERHPLWNSFIAGLAGEKYDKNDVYLSLKQLPADLRDWRFDNTHRKDYVLDSYVDRFGDKQFTTVPPYDEIRAMWWNGNPFEVVTGGDGRGIQGPMAILLAYWAANYYGVIEYAK